MMLQLLPIDTGTPQDKLSKELAIYLSSWGVESKNAIALAIAIMTFFDRGIKTGEIEAIGGNIITEVRKEYNFSRLNYPETKLTRKLKEALESLKQVHLNE